MKVQSFWIIIVLSALFALTGCQETPETRSAENVPTAQAAQSVQSKVGDYIIHHTAINTDQLSAETASQYGISRSKSQVLLNVVVMKAGDPGSNTATSGKVSANANNLTGQLKNISMREIREGDAIYYIGQTAVSDGEHLTFKIEVLPEGERRSLNVTFQQQFFTK